MTSGLDGFALEVLDLVVELSEWTKLLEQAWQNPDHVNFAGRRALLRDVFMVNESCPYCRHVHKSEHVRVNACIYPLERNVGEYYRRNSRKGLMQCFQLEKILLLGLQLYALSCFYSASAQRSRTYEEALDELTSLLLAKLNDSPCPETVDHAVLDILTWCTFVAADGHHRQAQGGSILSPAGHLLFEALHYCLGEPLWCDWQTLEVSLMRMMWCGQWGVIWKRCWDTWRNSMA
jgi:hypothetical protein